VWEHTSLENTDAEYSNFFLLIFPAHCMLRLSCYSHYKFLLFVASTDWFLVEKEFLLCVVSSFPYNLDENLCRPEAKIMQYHKNKNADDSLHSAIQCTKFRGGCE